MTSIKSKVSLYLAFTLLLVLPTRTIFAAQAAKVVHHNYHIQYKNHHPAKPHAKMPKRIKSYDDIMTAINRGKVLFDIRGRYEGVWQSGLQNAHAPLLRPRLGYKTAPFKGFSGLFEVSDNLIIGRQRYNSGGGTSPNLVKHAVILDPDTSIVLDQLYLNYSSPYQEINIRGGRQDINLDNQRFVGTVAFRQTKQTYDATAVTLKFIPNWTLYYAYVGRVNRIFGPDAPRPFNYNNETTHLANIAMHAIPHAALVGYAYVIDNFDVPIFSTDTYGVRLHGFVPIPNNAFSLLYTAEIAYQSSSFNNPVGYNQNYYHLMIGGDYNKIITAKFDWEQFGGDASRPGRAFRTPLATLRKFQGWADLFLTTPPAGINDYYGTVIINIPIFKKKVKFITMYHYFTAEATSTTYGDEIDLGLAHAINKHIVLKVQFASFHSHNAAFPHTTKMWAGVTLKS